MIVVPTIEEVQSKIALGRDLTALETLVLGIHATSNHVPSHTLRRDYRDTLTSALQRTLQDALRSHTGKLCRELAVTTNLPKDLAWPDLLDHLNHLSRLNRKPAPTPAKTDDQKDAERWRKLVASGRFIPSFNNPPLTLAPSDYTYAKQELDAAVDLYQP